MYKMINQNNIGWKRIDNSAEVCYFLFSSGELSSNKYMLSRFYPPNTFMRSLEMM
jgi:hypothetical protein